MGHPGIECDGKDRNDRRAPVWRAMSDLFLDTELTESDYAAIAESIRSAGFSTEEANEILLLEVIPVFWGNLINTAGEWQPWSEEEVRSMIEERISLGTAGKDAGFARPTFWRMIRHWLRSDWKRVQAYLD